MQHSILGPMETPVAASRHCSPPPLPHCPMHHAHLPQRVDQRDGRDVCKVAVAVRASTECGLDVAVKVGLCVHGGHANHSKLHAPASRAGGGGVDEQSSVLVFMGAMPVTANC